MPVPFFHVAGLGMLLAASLKRLLALPEARTADWSALSYVVYGASPIPLPVLRDATAVIGCSFLQSYGLTCDGGSFDTDGYLYLHDRLTDMIVTGGENVYPAEVESVLTGQPAVAEVAVVGVPSARWGERVAFRRRRPPPRRAGVRGRTHRLAPRPPSPLQVPGRRLVRRVPWPARHPASCRNRPSAPA